MSSVNYWQKTIKQSAVLNPIDRISEVLFGLIMVLTFTGAISASTDGREEVRELLWAALGCNVAWGFVDAIMYLMNVAMERGRSRTIIESIKTTTDEAGGQILKEEMQPGISSLMTPQELSELSSRLKKLPTPTKLSLITSKDLLSGLEIFLLVFLCTIPVALPFAFIDELATAMRTSNGIALLMLFIGGFLLGRYAGFNRLLTAITYTLIGIALVAITMVLGG